MRKGQKVRVLADGRVGVIADSHFVMWRGRKLVTCQVKFPDSKGEAPWFPIEQLTTELIERCTIHIKAEQGDLTVVFEYNHENKEATLTVEGGPEGLGRHRDTTQMLMACALVEGLSASAGVDFIRVSSLCNS